MWEHITPHSHDNDVCSMQGVNAEPFLPERWKRLNRRWTTPSVLQGLLEDGSVEIGRKLKDSSGSGGAHTEMKDR
jgi:hypothetical protein